MYLFSNVLQFSLNDIFSQLDLWNNAQPKVFK